MTSSPFTKLKAQHGSATLFWKALTMAEFCELGHKQQAMECPACNDAKGNEPAELAWWKWYKTRTSSKPIKELIATKIDALLDSLADGETK
jgi:hypothetical protein